MTVVRKPPRASSRASSSWAAPPLPLSVPTNKHLHCPADAPGFCDDGNPDQYHARYLAKLRQQVLAIGEGRGF